MVDMKGLTQCLAKCKCFVSLTAMSLTVISSLNQYLIAFTYLFCLHDTIVNFLREISMSNSSLYSECLARNRYSITISWKSKQTDGWTDGWINPYIWEKNF